MSASEGAAPGDQFNSDLRQISEPQETASSSGGDARDVVENADPEMFVTPPSTPHRIPPPTTCPPAPRRTRPKRRNYAAGVMIRPFHLTMEEILSTWQTGSGRRLPYRRIRLWKSGSGKLREVCIVFHVIQPWRPCLISALLPRSLSKVRSRLVKTEGKRGGYVHGWYGPCTTFCAFHLSSWPTFIEFLIRSILKKDAARKVLLSSDRREILEPPETANSPPAQGDVEGDDPLTPSVTTTSTPHRTPPATSCPPAPRKPRPASLTCGRKKDASATTLIHLTAEEIEAAWQQRRGSRIHGRIRRRRSEKYTKSRNFL